MPSVTIAHVSTFGKLAEPLICAALKELFELPVKGGVDWLKKRFTDHSTALPKAIATANERAWQAVSLALAGDSLFEKILGRFRDADLKAVRDQIKAFVADAETGYEQATEGLRAKACAELQRLKAEGRLGLDDVELTSIDLTRFASPSKTSDDAHWAVAHLAKELHSEAPHLSKVLTLTPPGGGTTLLAAAFAFFLRRQIATNEELSRELMHDSLRWLTLKQQAGFGNLELVLAEQGQELGQQMAAFFADNFAKLSDIEAKLDQLIEQNQISRKPESPLRLSVTSEVELNRLKQLRDRLREVPAELVEAKVHSLLGDGLAAAGQFAEAQQEHISAATVAHEANDRTAEAEAAYKQFKDACELKQWDSALEALKHAIAIDEKRFRPVPKHYALDAILGAGAFGVVLKCRNTISFDDDDNELVLAVKTFRETDLDRELKLIFSEANTLKNLTHASIIRVLEFGYAETDSQQRPFLAMEYFEGITLEDHLAKHGKLSIDDFNAIFSQIADALHTAHTGKRQIIHRDLKPANIMIRQVGDSWIVKVIDFGLAVKSTMRSASISVPHALRVTRDKSITGTIKYAAPEQLGERVYPVGPHSDVFAFGKTALECLFATVQPTPKHWKQLTESLAEMLARCVDEEYIANNPDDGRFHNFEPILAALAPTVPSSPISSSPPPAPPIVQEPPITLVPASTQPTPAKPLKAVPAKVLNAGDRHEITLPGGVKMAFAWCPPGTFMMGSPDSEPERDPNETLRQVKLTKGFYIGVHPVTQAQWQAVMGNNLSHFQGDTLPVERVSWNDTQEFIQTLLKKSQTTLRLPTEAEWEYAARGGTTAPFYFGSELNGTQANCNGNYPYGTSTEGPYLRKTTPVGSYAAKFPHPWGLADVHGNVGEWCQDWNDEEFYQSGPTTDPLCDNNHSGARVLRGGSWVNSASNCRAASRSWGVPGNRYYNLGFRVVFCQD